MKKIFNLYHKYEEIINYLIVGVLSMIVSLATYYLCVYTFLDPNVALELQMANIISWFCAASFAYITNKLFVFKAKNTNLLKEASSFYASRVLTLLMDMGIMFLLVTVLHGNDKIAKLIVQVVVTIANYIISKFFVFKKKNN